VICSPCKDGGQVLTRIKPMPATSFRDDLLAYVWAVHKACEAPESCPCHHDVSLDALQPGIGKGSDVPT
jgi:hypothetical protein